VRFSEEGIPVVPEGQGRPKEDDALGLVAEASETPIVEVASAEVAFAAVEVPEVATLVEVTTALDPPDEATTLEAPDEATTATLRQRRT
jgi:hypothetical protein